MRFRARKHLLIGAAVATVAVVGIGLGLVTGSDSSEPPGRITSVADPAPSTTPGEPATTAPGTGSAQDDRPAPGPTPAPAAATGRPTTTVAPPPAGTADRARPAGMTYTPQAVWPETLEELDRLQKAVDEGHQPWRNDPAEVVRAYLVDRGLPGAEIGAFQAGAVAGTGHVGYTAAGLAGRVEVERLLKGTIWYVAGSGGAAFPAVDMQRRGEGLVVVLRSGADGTMSARVKRPGGQWGPEQSVQAFTGIPRSITLETGRTSGDLIVQMRLRGNAAGVAEVFLGKGAEGLHHSAVDSESRLRVDGLGPVRIGMGLVEARDTSGLSMVLRESGSCVGYQTDAPPTGVGFTTLGSTQRLDLIAVSEPTIATISGIRVGSTLSEVRRAYGERLRGTVQDGRGKLMFRADDPSLDHLSLALLFSEGKVAAMWAGLRNVVEADEICA